MPDPNLPLGRETGYPNKYQPDVLYAIARSENRAAFIDGELPFHGVDIWNAWELTWLGPGDLPVVATAEIQFPATSPILIESKSLKLYLGSLAMSRYDSCKDVQELISSDLGSVAGSAVEVRVQPMTSLETAAIVGLPGLCLDSLTVNCANWNVAASLLQSDPETEVEENLYSHLLRSLCPVTAQPDIASVAIHYHGPRIDPASLLQYIVSFREHHDFHEACVERMFVDLLQRCKPQKLSVYARFQRRGGVDINPFRSNFEDCPGNLRLWRQ